MKIIAYYKWFDNENEEDDTSKWNFYIYKKNLRSRKYFYHKITLVEAFVAMGGNEDRTG